MHHLPSLRVRLILVMLLFSSAMVLNAFELAEIWGYLMVEDRTVLKTARPISDVAYFSAGIGLRGNLVGVPAIKESEQDIRRHLVVAELGNASKMHFVLDPGLPLRDRLVADLVEAALPFDGVQIDFEEIADSDGGNFLEFLGLLKTGLGPKILSVAVLGRTRAVSDAFDYRAIARIADRVLVMAYDEHWSGSAPGSIASPQWTNQVAGYAMQTIGPERLVMGLPFYGRIWADDLPTGAYRYSSVERIRKEQDAGIQRNREGIPYYQFSKSIRFTAFFEDRLSISDKLENYLAAGVRRIGFWRLGLEDPALWSQIPLALESPAP